MCGMICLLACSKLDGWIKNAIVYREKLCCCVLYYDPQAQVLCNGLYGSMFAIVVCMDMHYFLLFKRNMDYNKWHWYEDYR